MAMSMTEPQGCCEGDLQVFVEEGRSSCLSEGFIWLQLRGLTDGEYYNELRSMRGFLRTEVSGLSNRR